MLLITLSETLTLVVTPEKWKRTLTRALCVSHASRYVGGHNTIIGGLLMHQVRRPNYSQLRTMDPAEAEQVSGAGCLKKKS